ncbi:hypothetical protein A5886_001453 [Enterococcus sp. 8G7_MSG3316]|uniref:Major facilitator superfamily (MFS) profile domain-containing protein n=1 Tax=Candidatus Enterococcus testudinis TaxID=1834191 RepID=A0A242A5R4_9ENTE|nr:MFS transporter [Enterococcus sp. 8G7_MSG3316]OTN76376.1 hypothetical protein A5886_001453 [Enterococcus sp. 8G7_MSG3316]
MQNLSSVNKKNTTLSFWFATLSLITLFAASASPIPLYSIYRNSIGLTTESISLTAVFYFIGCIISLIILSRLSNYLGRKPVSVVAQLLGMTGLLLLLTATSPLGIIEARFFQGLACGLASSVMSVFIVESSANKSLTLVNAITGSSVLVGLAFGGLLSGVFVQINSHGSKYIYWLLFILLAICSVGILKGKESIPKRIGAIKSLRPQIKIPIEARKYLPSAIGIFAGTWAIGGYFQAFSSTIGVTVFHMNSPIISAIILASFMAPNLLGSSLSGRLNQIRGENIGILIFMLCIMMMYISFLVKLFPLFLIASIVAGIAQGIAYSSAMQALLIKSREEEKAGVLSVIYFISYGGAALPSFILGRFSNHLDFYQISLTYLIIVLLLGSLTLIYNSKIRNKEQPKNI